jgi:hypothetical protein
VVIARCRGLWILGLWALLFAPAASITGDGGGQALSAAVLAPTLSAAELPVLEHRDEADPAAEDQRPERLTAVVAVWLAWLAAVTMVMAQRHASAVPRRPRLHLSWRWRPPPLLSTT